MKKPTTIKEETTMKKPTTIEQAIERLKAVKIVLSVLDDRIKDNERWKETDETDLKTLLAETPESEIGNTWKIQNLRNNIEEYENAIEAAKAIKALIEEVVL